MVKEGNLAYLIHIFNKTLFVADVQNHSFFLYLMELILTERIQACVKSALSNSSFPEKYKKEAKDIINVELEDSKEHPISLDLLRQLPKLTGK